MLDTFKMDNRNIQSNDVADAFNEYFLMLLIAYKHIQ
jgi:hypothetical protein